MNTPDKCPHCGSLADQPWSPQYNCGTDCGTFLSTGNMSGLCEERAAHAATRAELEKVRAELAELRSRWYSAGTAVTAEITRIQAQRDKALNTVDRMRDEFQRIVAMCVDVIVQRDEWQRRAERLELALRLASDEPNIDRARKIADEALAQKEAGRE